MLWLSGFVVSEKKIVFLFWMWPMGTFLHKSGRKIVIFRGFRKRFFRTTGFQLKFLIFIEFPNILHWKPAKKIKSGMVLGQNLGQIMSNIVKIVKKQAISLFFSYFAWEMPFKAESSHCKTT